MVRIHCKQGLLGEHGTRTWSVAEPITTRDLVAAAREHLPKTVALQVACNGRLLEAEHELDAVLGDRDEVIVSPVTTYGIEWGALIVQALIYAAVSVAVNYAISALTPRHKPQGVPQERGDNSSATYSWDGVTTSYGQGFPVPIVYGEHGVGGQALFTNAAVQSSGLSDRLDLILALSEGPIHRVGDTIAAELDNLGGLGGTGSGGPLPNGIWINNTLLETAANAPVRNYLTFTTWSTAPVLGVGTVLQFSIGGSGGPWVGSLQVVENLITGVDILAVLNGAGVPTQPYVPGTWIRELSSGAVAQVATTALVTRPNPAPGALAFIRPGTLDQTPLPSNPFKGTSTTFAPSAQLEQESQETIFAYSGEESIEAVSFVFSAPAGCYVQDPQGNALPFPVAIEVSWRPADTSAAWRAFYQPFSGPLQFVNLFLAPKYGPQLQAFTGNLTSNQAAVQGPIEVRVLRRSPSAGQNGVATIVWRNVSFNTSHVLSYPRCALLGLSLSASGRFNGGLPNVLVRVQGVRVRVWHPAYGWSPSRVWDPITTGDFAFMRHAPGRNPAWVLLDFLLAPWGLGRWLKEADIDLPAFFRWAIFCDQTWGATTAYEGPEYAFDGVLDAPRPAWETVLQIAAAGRGAPVFRNGKVSVTYQYRDAHASLGATIHDQVAARTPVQLITAAACDDVQVSWLPKATRATAFNFQFLNAELLWRQDVFPVQDTEASMNDADAIDPERYRVEVIQAYGITRATQLFREGIFKHRISRLVRRELSFVTGPWALAAEIGDLFEFEHESLRPFGDDVPTSMFVVVGGTSTTTVVVDHDPLVLTPSTCELVVRDPSGKPQRAVITFATRTSVNGRFATSCTLATAVTCAAGAQCIIGLISKTTEVYQIVSITLQQDLKRAVRALQWVPSLYDPLTVADFEAGGSGTDETGTGADLLVVDKDTAEPTPPAVNTLDDVVVLPQRDGGHAVAFARSPTKASRTVRIYARPAAGGAWQLLGATEGDEVRTLALVPFVAYEFSVCDEDVNGEAVLPEAGRKATATPGEFAAFAPPPVGEVRFALTPAGDASVSWSAVDLRDLDYYEVRIGPAWNGARVVYRGLATSTIVPGPAVGSIATVAARSRSGLYGQPVAVAVPAWTPAGRVSAGLLNDTSGTPAGSHSSTTWNATDLTIELSGANLSGTYTSPVLDAGYSAAFWWTVDLATDEIDDTLVGECDDLVGSGEAQWRGVNGREASPFRPGPSDWDTIVDDDNRLVGDCGDDEVHGAPGAVGSYTRCRLETRFEVAGVWSAWSEHRDGVVAASKMQARVVLDRLSSRYQVRVSQLRLACFL